VPIFYRELRETGTTLGIRDKLYPFEQMTKVMGFKVMGFEAVWEFDRKHAR